MTEKATFAVVASLVFLVGGSAEAQEAQEDQDSDSVVLARLVLDVSSLGETDEAERLGPMHTGRLRPSQARSFGVRLPPGKCFVVVGKGGPGIDNLDVRLLLGRSVLARDTETSAGAVARWCSGDTQVAARLSVSAFRGSGQFAAAIYAREPAVAQREEAELTGETALTRLASLVAQRGGDMRPVTVATRESLHEGQRLERIVTLSPGRCYRVLAAGERGVDDLDVALIDPGGATLQRDASDDALPTLGVVSPLCPATPGEYRVVLHLESGEGAFAWQVLRETLHQLPCRWRRLDIRRESNPRRPRTSCGRAATHDRPARRSSERG
jgi:hypothetical protein